MKYNIYLLQYNNYYNRQVKKLDTLQDYINSGYVINTLNNCNFEMSDGITSSLIINYDYLYTVNQPDYIIVQDRTDLNNISRWFIIDSNLTRGGQYQFSVKRDICADYKDLLLNSTCFIERGFISSENDLIFNNEEQQYSQIKKSQTPLYDETGVPWIVGYIPKTLNKSSDTTIKSVVRPSDADITVQDITNWEYYQYVTTNPDHTFVYSDNVENAFRFVVQLPIKNIYNQGNSYQMGYFGYSIKEKTVYAADIHDLKTLYPSTFTEQESGFGYFNRTESAFNNDVSDKGWYNENHTNISAYIEVLNRTLLYIQPGAMDDNGLMYQGAIDQYRAAYNIDVNLFNYIENNLQGKTIKDLTTGKIYNIVLKDQLFDKLEYPSGFDQSVLKFRIKQCLDLTVGNSARPTDYGYSAHIVNDNSNNNQIRCIWKLKQIGIELVEVGNARTILPKDDTTSNSVTTAYRNHCVDQVYDIFAIPFGALEIKNGTDTITCNKDIGLAIAQSFVTTLGSDVVYDIQMLPYCPVREYIMNDGTFDITAADETKVRPIYFGDNNLLASSYVFYCSNSKADNITLLDKNNNLEPYSIQVTDVKRQYNTEMYRLSSPNFASSFEFNAAQNGGVLSFKTSYTYKPYNPYIRVRPDFGRMFGQDFRDGRGLILQGDFSIPTMSNAWTNFELQNKNYLNSFNREVQSMNLQNKIASEQDVWNAITSSLSSGIQAGAGVGLSTGNPYAAAAAAIVGTGVSAASGIRDIQNNKKLRNDAISKAKTLFKYQMDNIKALPNTIRNVGCLTVDNVLVPVLEFYQASDDELDAFDKKMKYYGMSINKVGKLVDYVNPLDETFIQGYLLRLLPVNGINEETDNHLAEELSDEIQKGLYI